MCIANNIMSCFLKKKKNMECININKNGAVISFKDTSEYLY